ncbi:hypothetical protein DFQ28_011166 [Apophysomyces sp. BC1034]|nr:hypothetical protein DFQ29_009472 [Apophysomyces sp. BC1021]KAG0173255.1 hypothetical protein DFQ30_008399 [Apophysomyces sp. BC1015]KAG0191691.1 hypothetical protein DFQ28_011166 [Apophysomyces sp. BC1034]
MDAKVKDTQTRTFTDSNDSDRQRNDTTRQIEREIWRVLHWENPVRSGAFFVLLIGITLLARRYSLLQFVTAILTIAIGLNLLYVTLTMQTQKLLTETEAVHPYRAVFDNRQITSLDEQDVARYTTVAVHVGETVIRGLTRIVLIENNLTSLKWLVIAYATYVISAHAAASTITLFFIISAFIFPRLYMSNKDIVDAHLHQGEALLSYHLRRSQDAASEGMQSALTKAKAYMSAAGSTAGDAKNEQQGASATEKQD